jgi:hypothetical protein
MNPKSNPVSSLSARRSARALALASGLGAAVAGLAAGCGKTEECVALEGLVADHEKLARTLKERASQVDKAEANARNAEVAANRFLETSGLALDRGALQAELSKRLAAVPTSTMSFGELQVGVGEESGQPITSEQFTITLPARDARTLWDRVGQLAQVPPVLRLLGIARGRAPGTWALTLERIIPDRPPLMPKAQPTPSLPDGSAIPSRFGFCGASQLRATIAAKRDEIARHRDAAERLTVALPTTATFDGVRRRAERAVGHQREARAIMDAMMRVVIDEKLEFRALGYETPEVVLEIDGGPRERRLLEDRLSKYVNQIKPVAPTSRQGVVQIRITNDAELSRVTREGESPFPNLPPMPGQAPSGGGHDHDHGGAPR